VFYDLGFDEAWRDFSADVLLVLAGRVGLRPTLKWVA
jgi:hypothetical protein